MGDWNLEPRNATVRAEDLQTKYLKRGILLDVPFSWQALSGPRRKSEKAFLLHPLPRGTPNTRAFWKQFSAINNHTK